MSRDATDDLLDRLLASNAPLRASLARVRDEAVAAVDDRLLELAGARAALLLGVEHDPVPPPADDRERACVDLVEQMVIDVTGVSDDQVRRVAEHLGDDGAATFVAASLAVEQRLRMRAVWEHLGIGS